MDMAPWPQEIVVKPMEEMITNTTTSPNNNNTNNNTKPQPSTSLERKVRPQKDQALNCPRCNSTNTKFCYYNNYSLTQPRYFCKGCRRYWTAGGSLRNIPVGGGSRKNKRPSSSSISSSSATSKIKLSDHHHHHHQIQQHQHQQHHQHHVMPTNPNSKIHEQGHDLNLGFPSTLSEFMQLPNMEPPNTSNNNTSHLSALELLTGLTSSSRGLMTPFMQMQIPDPNSVFPSGFSLQGDHHFKPSLNFSLDGIGNNNGGGMHHHGVQESGGRILFPFEDLKSTTTTATTTTTTADHHQQHQHQNQNQNQHHHGDQQITRDHQQQQQQGDSTGYWTGMLGGGAGSSW